MHDAIKYLQQSLNGLKDFQRATVAQIVTSFSDYTHSHRVLVADEVGLGKTIVAKGVISELLIKRITNGQPNGPMRVTYICSNQTLATENKQKLNVFNNTGSKKYIQEPSFNRLVELAVKPKLNTTTDDKLLEISSLTPSTSFTLTHGDGNVRERFIIYKCLMQDEQLRIYDKKLEMVFCNNVASWKYQDAWLQTRGGIDGSIATVFTESLKLPINTKIDDEILNWLELTPYPTASELLVAIGIKAKETSLDSNKLQRKWLYRFRSLIRTKLAQACAQNIKADLFILDEFQRFNSLLHSHLDADKSEVSVIADQIFNLAGKPKILLLSATPFKAVNTIHEAEKDGEEPHHKEFSKLFKFLTHDDSHKLAAYHKERNKLLNQILALNGQTKHYEMDNSSKTKIEGLLRPYICRTERSQISENFDAIYQSNSNPQCFDTFSQDDITYYRSMTALTKALDKIDKSRQSSQLLHFYKAAPWALSFLSGYQLRTRLESHLDDKEFQSAIATSSDSWVPKAKIENYSLELSKHTPNAKLRSLLDVVFSPKSEELLWIPPTTTNYPHEGPFKENDDFSKTLLFSAWAMVPRALSGLLSYEAERRLLKNMPTHYSYSENHRKNKADVIHFKANSTDALVAWSMIYPAKSLMDLPRPQNTSSLDTILTEREHNIREKLIPLARKHGENKGVATRGGNTLWYALAPILLDKIESREWLNTWLDNETRTVEEYSGRSSHLQDIKRYIEDHALSLGPMPNDLPHYLALLSVASPSICAAKMLYNIWNSDHINLMKHASNVGLSILQMFNKSESQNTLHKVYGDQKKYWFQIIQYCADGNIQAMLDEYGHLLHDAGLSYEQASERIASTSGFQPTTVSCQFDTERNKKVDRSSSSDHLRCHYAVPLGIQKTTDEAQVRVTHIRDAFNSPFKPFVLNSTSIGQEGLDFHWYCNRVVHWNLPSNPIDIEQREGRVNRYKSLVVRRRAVEYFDAIQFKQPLQHKHLWKHIFDTVEGLTKVERSSDLVPYWHLPLDESNSHIERVTLMMPMSREVERLEQMFKSLSMYRLTFGQPRQQELLENLLNHEFSPETVKAIKLNFVINLAPINYRDTSSGS